MTSNVLQSIDNKIKNRVYGTGRGSVFTPSDFIDLGSRVAVDKVLSRLTAKGTLRRLARGLYDFPRQDSQLGTLFPSVQAVASALKGRDAVRLQPAGGYAANLLGLSDQVPMRVVFLTDGASRRVRLGRQEIVLKHTTPRNVAAAGRVSGLVIQALRHMGRRNVDDRMIAQLRKRLSHQDKKQLLKDISLAPAWIVNIMRRIAGP